MWITGFLVIGCGFPVTMLGIACGISHDDVFDVVHARHVFIYGDSTSRYVKFSTS
jgi:hypothetical protein